MSFSLNGRRLTELSFLYYQIQRIFYLALCKSVFFFLRQALALGRMRNTCTSVLQTTENMIRSGASAISFWIPGPDPLSLQEAGWEWQYLIWSLQPAQWVLPLSLQDLCPVHTPSPLFPIHPPGSHSLLPCLSGLELCYVPGQDLTRAGRWEEAMMVMWPVPMCALCKHLASQHSLCMCTCRGVCL